MKIPFYFLVLLSIVIFPLIAEGDREDAIKAEWFEYIENALQQKNKYDLPISEVLISIENQIIQKYGSFEAFDMGFKKRDPEYLFGFVKIFYKAKKDLLEEKQEAINEQNN